MAAEADFEHFAVPGLKIVERCMTTEALEFPRTNREKAGNTHSKLLGQVPLPCKRTISFMAERNKTHVDKIHSLFFREQRETRPIRGI